MLATAGLANVEVVLSLDTILSVGVSILGGSSTGMVEDWEAGRRRRRLGVRGGNSALDTEYQGSYKAVSKALP